MKLSKYIFMCGNENIYYFDVTDAYDDNDMYYIARELASHVCREQEKYNFAIKKVSNKDFFYWVEVGQWKEQSTIDFVKNTRLNISKIEAQ